MIGIAPKKMLMPIKKENLELYPKNWRKISWWIIHVRAQNKCEGVYENGEKCQAENHKPHPVTGKKVVLSVAHLDHNPRNSDQDLTPEEAADLSKSNMRAFCQLCHNRWDREHRNESIKQTYREKHGVPDEEAAPESVVVTYDKKKIMEATGEAPDSAEKDLLLYETVQAGIGDSIVSDLTTEELKEVLRELIRRLPSLETIEHTIVLKSMELNEEYMRILNLPNEQFSTPQVQAQLTVLRSKLNSIEQLRGLHKMMHAAAGKLKGGRTAPVPVGQDSAAGDSVEEATEEEEAINLRGLGIRKLMTNRKNAAIQQTTED